ncbi:hypothetical protein E4S40_11355 [Algoriphagus kandeliae]|uniref:DUF4221 domain-containing protein n=1 Tax=Algoriphagus kandeliae TaxID=2562278 RepID=A0A4Y9QPN8_9BACT|nr:hypothetical protein [Algoriphagus kandeliae]TFV94604.1 hypothetical protein E4S40_11355 [Algoriphagus kandeliae]
MSFSRYFTFFGFIALITSCSQKEASEKSTEDNPYFLTKIDSFEVENLTRVFIRDYSPEEGIYLGYSMVEDEILEISEEGEILKRVKKKGEGPGLYGNWNPIGISFGPNQERVVELPFRIVTYNSNYEVLQEQRIQSPLPIRTFGPMGRTEYFQNGDSTMYLVGPSNYLSAHYLIMNEEGRDTLKNFFQINIQTGEMKSVVPYREESPYKNTEGIYQELMTKSFLVDHITDELWLVHALSKEIEIYDLPLFNLSKTIPLNHEEFMSYSPVPIGTQGNDEGITPLRFLAGRNKQLIQLEPNLFLINYYKGISEAAYQTRIAEDATYTPTIDPKENSIIIILDGKQVGPELPSVPGSILFGLGDGKFLVQEPENPEIEEEKTRFSVYQLIKDS